MPLRELRRAPPRKIVDVAMQSLDVAPNSRWYWMPRAPFLLTYSAVLQEDEVPAVRAQLRTIWAYAPNLRTPLIVAAMQARNESMLLDALKDDPDALAEFQTLRQGLR
jgi:hypothetical protein